LLWRVQISSIQVCERASVDRTALVLKFIEERAVDNERLDRQ
jgi:hypothetical protein